MAAVTAVTAGSARRVVTAAERRALLVHRHHLRGTAAGPDEAAASVVALHATEPTSVHLAVLARSRASALADVDAALHGRRSLVRWLGVRRTLFAVPRAAVPVWQAAASDQVAAALGQQLVRRLALNGTEPPLDPPDPAAWLAAAGADALAALDARGSALGWQLGADAPRLRTAVLPRTASEARATVTSPLLTLLGAEGRIVRAAPERDWTSRRLRWEPVARWWPDGLPRVDIGDARAELVRSWLAAFGPAPASDLAWWTGWGVRAVAAALARLPVTEVELHDDEGSAAAGVALDDGSLDRDLAAAAADGAADGAPSAALLPVLDPTPMGWQQRSWFLRADPDALVDRSGNLGPTAWWGGEAVGGWGVTRGGEVRVEVLVDRGAEAAAALAAGAVQLQQRLGGAVVRPTVATALERRLASS